jgi:hypothetical protein
MDHRRASRQQSTTAKPSRKLEPATTRDALPEFLVSHSIAAKFRLFFSVEGEHDAHADQALLARPEA